MANGDLTDRILAIDTHAHIIPPSVGVPGSVWSWKGNPVERRSDGRLGTAARKGGFKLTHEGSPEAVEARLREMDAHGIDLQLLSLLPSMWMYAVDGHDTAEAARQSNDDLAAIAGAHPTRFRALAHLPLADSGRSIAELERVMSSGTMAGAALGTNVPGRNWDSPELFDVLEAAASLGALVLFHPVPSRLTTEPPRYHLDNLIGNPAETTLALGDLIFGGVFERLPNLKALFVHGGGYASFAIGRFDHGHRVRPEARAQAPQLPSIYLRRMYFDNLLHDETATRYLADTVGVDHVVLGTDYPADMGPTDPVRQVLGWTSFSDDEKRAILGGTVARLLNLDASAIGGRGSA